MAEGLAGDDAELRRVTGVFVRTSDHVRVLTVAGDKGNVETLGTTDEHPFVVQGRGWTNAGDVQAGDWLQEPDGSWQGVLATAREDHAGGITVYNLEVEGDHTYFVADADTSFTEPVWVHNACTDPRQAVARIAKNRAAARGDLRDAMASEYGEAALAGKQVHHIIPYDMTDNGPYEDIWRVIIRASKANFNYSGIENGIALSSHNESHQAYTNEIARLIRARMAEARTPEGAKRVLEEVIAEARRDTIRRFWPNG